MKFLCLLGLILTVGHARASEDSLYDFVWLDPDKQVYVLQNKLYKKEHSFYADIGYIANYTSKFQSTSGFQGKLGYYIREDWGIEAFGNFYSNSDNDDFKNIQIINEQRPFIRKLTSSYGLLGIWSPFYGKINTFNRIFYFDWSFGAGIAQVNTEDNLASSLEASQTEDPVEDRYEAKTYTGAVLKTTLKFHFKENIHLGVEYMNTYYQAPSPATPTTDKLRINTDLILSVGYSI